MKNIIILLSVISLSFLACKKDGSGPSSNQPAYIGKWHLDTYVIWNRFLPTDPVHKDTTKGLPTEYIEFSSDGHENTCFVDVNGHLHYDTVPYQIINNIIYDDTFPDSSLVQVSGNRLTISNVDYTGRESLWWNYKK